MVTVIDLADCYRRLESDPRFLVRNLSDISGTNSYCSEAAASAIRKEIMSLPGEEPFRGIHIIGSGNYHYLSLFFIEIIKEPFFLLHIDKHPDCEKGAFSDSLLSCGNWIRTACTLPELSHIYMYGVDRALFKEAADDGISEKISLIESADELPKELPVYISIDKDVLSEEYAATDWDQGNMALPRLLAFLKEVKKAHVILGTDICGDKKEAPSDRDTLLNGRTDDALLKELL